ncbi:MAG TPA: DUF5362 family protein [Chitinophagaceae bacterium]|jgi:hypothetical protein|nr:DUF5362 family protein [Chitinophagaceae bacterium]
MDSYRDSNPQQEPQPLFQLNFEPQNAYMLRSSASWARILGVAGIILGVLLIAIFGITLSNAENRDSAGVFRDDDNLVLGCMLFIIGGIVFIVGGVFAFRFGKRITTSLAANSQEGLNNAFLQLRNYFALRSITVILVLVLLLLGMGSATSRY